MKWVDEYRDKNLVENLVNKIHQVTRHPWTIMEICGGQTHSIMKYGLDELIPNKIRLVHGPGCPVCVTPIRKIDQAIYLAKQPNTIFTTFGDMLRVPGSDTDFLHLQSDGYDIRFVYSPLDALQIAENNPDKTIVFFGVGFETTAPAIALTIFQAEKKQIKNFMVLTSLVCVPPAIDFLMSQPACEIQGFLAAGHVCSIMGYWQYIPLSETYKLPMTITGFEPVDILEGILMTVDQLETGSYHVENQYKRIVSIEGNKDAQRLLKEVFSESDQEWRGIGVIAKSGLSIQKKYARYDAENRIKLDGIVGKDESLCEAGLILQGKKEPTQCAAFGNLCTPEHPLGSPMVSSEGACAAYFNYRLVE